MFLPTAPEVVRPTEVPSERWANGLGSTRVLVDDPAVRISIADIEGQAPFSTFPGIDRMLVPFDGSDVVLEINGVERSPARLDVVAFRGEDAVAGRAASGTARVLNVMTRRGTVIAGCGIHRGGAAFARTADLTVFLGGHAELDGRRLLRGTVLRPSAHARVTLMPTAVFAVLSLAPAP